MLGGDGQGFHVRPQLQVGVGKFGKYIECGEILIGCARGIAGLADDMVIIRAATQDCAGGKLRFNCQGFQGPAELLGLGVVQPCQDFGLLRLGEGHRCYFVGHWVVGVTA